MKLLTDKEIRLRNEIAERRFEIARIRSLRKWTCKKCGCREVIKNLYLVMDYYYVSPYSCTGGDYWKQNDELKVICPECGIMSRYYGDTNQMYRLVKEYSNSFGGLIDEYSDSRARVSGFKLIRKLPAEIGPAYDKLHQYLKKDTTVDIRIEWFNA